jgi:hypothetical protein
MMVSAIATQTKLSDKAQASSEKKEHWGNNIHENLALSYLFMGGSQYPLSYPSEPGNQAKAFLSVPKAQILSTAVQNLTIQRKTTHTIDLLYATRLHQLSFENQNPDLPGGLSIFFAVPSPTISSKTAGMSEFTLQLHMKSGTLSNSQIAKLSRSQLHVPTTRANLAIAISNQLKTIELMFTMYCHLYRELDKLGGIIQTYQGKLDWLFSRKDGQRYIATLMAMIDAKTNEFFMSCLNAHTIHEVNFAILNFQPEIDQLILGNPIQGQIPHAVEAYLTRGQHTLNTDSDSDDSATPTSSRKRKRQAQKKKKAAAANIALATADTKNPTAAAAEKPATNKSPVDAWTLAKGGNMFASYHKQREGAPLLNGTAPCLKFHLLGKCNNGNKCKFRSTHTTKMDDAYKASFTKWFKGCAKATVAADDAGN